MRRWLAAAALAGAAVLVLVGCTRPAGVDGNLTDDWAAIGEPTLFTPERGTCHPRLQEIGSMHSYEPLDCTQQHEVETVHVGTFEGPGAEGAVPPPKGSPLMRAAYRDCDKRVSGFVGAEWRTGRLMMIVVPPSRDGWTGGARWYRCDVAEVHGLDSSELVDRTGSLRLALDRDPALSYGCFIPKLAREDIASMTPVACTKPHRSEFVGVYTAPDVAYGIFDSDEDRIHEGCYSIIAKFAKVPDDSRVDERVGSIYYYPSAAEWAAGNRGVQCFLWMEDRNLTRSLRGAGPRGLPRR